MITELMSDEAAKSKPQPTPEWLLGEILVRRMGLPLATLQAGLDAQKRDGRRLGRILLDMGAVTEQQLIAALFEQKRRIRAG